MTNPLISAKWLYEHLSTKDLIILDASPSANKSGLVSDFQDLQIQGARYFDLKNNFSDTSSEFPNTFPSREQFQEESQKLGINSDSTIVVYDNLGIYTSPRVWWMFRSMGHENVYVLDGGLSGWISNKYPSEKCIRQYEGNRGNFIATPQASAIKTIDYISTNIDQCESLVIDARSKGRFDGTSPEPRKGLSSGHIAGSKNLPFQEVLHNGYYKSDEELKIIFDAKGVEDTPIVFSCGSGLTACILLLAAVKVLPNHLSIFDGSWTEWATKMMK